MSHLSKTSRSNTENKPVGSKLSLKRPVSNTMNEPFKKPRSSFDLNIDHINDSQESVVLPVKDQINIIDIHKKLCIYEYLPYIHKDLLVKEYVDVLLETEILPIIPPLKEIEKYVSNNQQTQIPKELSINVIKNFMTFFQKQYHKDNLDDANKKDVQLTNPIIRFSVSSFQLLPLKTHDDITDSKKMLMSLIQGHYAEGSSFTLQLLLIRNIKYIFDVLKERETPDVDFLPTFWNTFCILYMKAKTEFLTKFRMKSFNWDEKESKVQPVLPHWRKENLEQPKEPFNFYAKEITSRIENEKEDFSSAYVTKLYTDVKTRLKNVKSNGAETGKSEGEEDLRSFAVRPKLKPRRKPIKKKNPTETDDKMEQ